MKGATFGALWGWPIALAVLSGAGLVGGLLGNGGWDWLTWVGLGVPCAAGVWFGLRGRRPR
jgi:hypothetical protein